MKKLFLLVGICATLSSCTENARTRQFGGKEEFVLPDGMELVNVTWKEGDMWLLMKDNSGTHYFRERSQFGVFEGEVIIHNN